MNSPAASVNLPEGWGVAQLTLHEEEIDTVDGVPFAATIIIQLRFDVPSAMPIAELVERDLESFKGALGNFRLIEKTKDSLEFRLVDSNLSQEMQQLVLYFTRGDYTYSLTATQRPGAFHSIKNMAPQIKNDFLGGQK